MPQRKFRKGLLVVNSERIFFRIIANYPMSISDSHPNEAPAVFKLRSDRKTIEYCRMSKEQSSERFCFFRKPNKPLLGSNPKSVAAMLPDIPGYRDNISRM